ncbi:hypothetical protein [Tengunoibacter tsumagoiensis]|uniref:Leucine-binding protein domain-containing protein n=1 Tax=Tengunoibacter tsumagoiensis TaxID=2014871 RepID=A0A402A613_9CHLR|nr:hypothetical protein [Tengunoibacter tsumagoiensis]GCE14445.1 hypothetical protein KTT_43040 [Tengunoibacter tsumagoiensis]
MIQEDTPQIDQDGSEDEQKKHHHTNVRFITFIILIVFLLICSGNQIAFSFITGLLALFTVGTFEPVSNKIIEFVEKPLAWVVDLFKLLFAHLASRGLKRHSQLFLNVCVALVLLLTLGVTTLSRSRSVLAGNINDTICLNWQASWWISCSSGLGMTMLPNGVQVGLIKDGSAGPFDQTSLNESEKQIEKLIFAQNKRACSSPHITLAVVTMLSRTVENPYSSANVGLQDLRGAVLAQQKYNSQHPTFQLCLVIANLGTSETANENSGLVSQCSDCYSLPIIVHQLAQFAHTDGHLRGIIGFPYSQQSKEALAERAKLPQTALLPIISPSASATTLSNNGNFYRIASPDTSQGLVLGQFFCNHLLHGQWPTLAIFSDDADVYSHSLQFAFSNHLSCADKVNLVHESYKNGNTASIQAAVRRALLQDHASYIFFPGYNADLDNLEFEIRNNLRDQASTLTVMGGDGLYDIDGTTHFAYAPIYSTIFTSPVPADSAFVQQYLKNQFPLPYLANSIPSQTLFPPHTILAYDAATAFTEAFKHFGSSDFSQADFNTTLGTVSFSGVSGYTALQGDQNNGHISDRNEGSVYVTCTDRLRTIHLTAYYTSVNITNGNVIELPASNEQVFCN